jgi:hypothetical protein
MEREIHLDAKMPQIGHSWNMVLRAPPSELARIFHELLSRDHEDGRATGQPQDVGPEAYLNGTSQGEPVLSLSKEHPRTPGRTAISVVAAGDS